MEVSREVSDAVAKGQPVVALETTLVTHGLPHPDNIKYFIFAPTIFYSLKNIQHCYGNGGDCEIQ